MATLEYVFPCAQRPFEDGFESKTHDSRLWTEQNVTNIIKHICDRHNYVISINGSDTDATIEFIIQGYYFKVSSVGVGSWAHIEIDEETGELVWNETTKTAVVIDSNPPEGDDPNSLKLSEENKIKFDESSIKFTVNKIKSDQL